MGKKEKKKFGGEEFFPFPHSMGKRVVECARQKRERSETAKLIPPPHPRLFFSGDKNSVGRNGTSFFSVGEGLLSRLFFLRPIRSGAKGGREEDAKLAV